MMAERIERVAVWPALLRLLHVMMAVTVIILLLSGALMHSGMILNTRLFEHLLVVWHLPAGHVLAVVMLIRILLLMFSKGVSSWKALIPENVQTVIGVAVFYLSLARNNLPAYFAHNPLWKLLYLFMLLLLVVQVVTGLLLESSWLRSVFKTDSSSVLLQHQALYEVIGIMVLAHVITAILHDWKTQTGEISAMVNGHKFFTFEQKQKQAIDTVAISLDSLVKPKK